MISYKPFLSSDRDAAVRLTLPAGQGDSALIFDENPLVCVLAMTARAGSTIMYDSPIHIRSGFWTAPGYIQQMRLPQPAIVNSYTLPRLYSLSHSQVGGEAVQISSHSPCVQRPKRDVECESTLCSPYIFRCVVESLEAKLFRSRLVLLVRNILREMSVKPDYKSSHHIPYRAVPPFLSPT